MEGTHVSVGITHTELQRHNVLAPAVRGRAPREREDAFTLRGFRSPVCDIIAVFPMLLEHTKRLKMKIFCRWDHSLVG